MSHSVSVEFGDQKISHLLMKFSLPAIVGMLVNALYNVVDRIFIGQGVGPVGIAGVTVGYPMMLIMIACTMLVGLGTTTLLSIRLGEQKKDEAESIMGNGVTLLILVSLFLTFAGLIFMDPLLILFGASDVVLPYARDFMRIILLGTIFQGIGFGMNNFIRAEGSPRVAMITMLIGALLNAILNPIFVFIFHWGMKGAALATVIAQGVSAFWVLYYFLGGLSTLKIHKKNLLLKKETARMIFLIGSAPFAMQMAASLLQVILNQSLARYGNDMAISGLGIVQSIALLIMMPIFGINQGSQPIIGFNYGAQRFDRVKEALKLAIYAATGVVVAGFLITRIFPVAIIKLFNHNDAELISFGVRALKIFLMMLPLIGFQIVAAHYFQAVGKPKHAMVLSLSRQVLILIPALLILPRYYGLDGVLIAAPFSDAVSFLITGFWLFRELKSLDRKQAEIADYA